jgi:hypothetical protein
MVCHLVFSGVMLPGCNVLCVFVRQRYETGQASVQIIWFLHAKQQQQLLIARELRTDGSDLQKSTFLTRTVAAAEV